MHNHRNDQDAVRERVHHFLSVADRVIAHKYPTSSKHYLAKFFEVPLQPVCRMQSVTMNDQDVSIYIYNRRLGFDYVVKLMLAFLETARHCNEAIKFWPR